jgi:exopolysaccharide biosynthesis polyprenyl glycosylphosphotransferase
MLREHARTVRALLGLVDLALMVSAWPVANASLRAVGWALPGPLFPGPPTPAGLLVLIGWIGTSALFGLYEGRRREQPSIELIAIAKSIGLVGLLVLSSASLWPDPAPRATSGAYVLAAFLLVSTSRLVVRGVARSARMRGYNARYFAVVGSGDQAEEIVERIAMRREWGYVFLGYILEDAEPQARGDLPILGRLRDLGTLLEENVIDVVFFAVTNQRMGQIESAVQLCQEQGVDVGISLGSFADGPSRMMVVETGGRPMLSFSTIPASALDLAVKRAFDVVVSALLLALLSPLLAVVAMAIAIDSPGPVLFRQRRVGRNGREFSCLKFRSMRIGAEADLGMLRTRNEMDGPVFKMRQDPRVTRVGRLIRKTSLDELPQFWNVLRGEMSVVGPRPPLPDEVRQYQRWQRRRLSVRPGITCTWQVSGRNDIDFERWMRLDLDYIDRWSFWSDLRICFQTIPAVLFTRGAR